MGKRSRRRAASNSASTAGRPLAEVADLVDLASLGDLAGTADVDLKGTPADYTDPDGNVLALRISLPPAARREYADALAGLGGRASTTREDAWQRAVELLFERLAVSWTIAGAPIGGQRELLMRYRAASADERAWIRNVLREHCAEWFPDVEAP